MPVTTGQRRRRIRHLCGETTCCSALATCRRRSGADQLIGNQGEDILIGGLLVFQRTEAALAAIMSEWTSGRSYGERVANLRGDSTSSSFGDRKNGEVYLTPAGDAPTVRNDLARDRITGSADRDGFFAALAEDELTDLKPEDVFSELGTTPNQRCIRPDRDRFLLRL
jgi:hypothetical protein